MVNYGVTEDGFNKKSFLDILNSLENNAKRRFGENVDLTPGSPLKLMIDLMSAELVELWNNLDSCYKSGFVNTATGTSLDNVSKLVGIERSDGSPATGTVTFYRNTPLTESSYKIIPAGTVVTTADVSSTKYVTTKSVYFKATITDEEYDTDEETTVYNCENYISSITSIVDSDGTDYTSDATFNGRTITLSTLSVPAGKTIKTTYVPLSVSAPIECVDLGEIGNVNAEMITVMSNPFDFIHYIKNEQGLSNGVETETDSELRDRIVNARESFGKGTQASIEYSLKEVDDVSNVKVYNPHRINTVESSVGDGSTSIFVSNTPIYKVNSVTGHTVDSFVEDTGEIILTTTVTDGASVDVDYDYVLPGKIKIYVAGGVTSDVVSAIESSRAAGVHSVGYGTGDSNADGDDEYPYSWFYRPNSALIDVTVTVYFDQDSELTTAQKSDVLASIETKYNSYINSRDMHGRVYRNTLVKKALETHTDIVDVTFDSWAYNSVSESVSTNYIEVGVVELPIANTIVINDTVVS